MKIQWNKITWYSKVLALALFVALPFIGFYFGDKYGKITGFLNGYEVSGQIMQNITAQNNTDYYQNTATWQTDMSNSGDWSIAYPIDFQTDDSYSIVPSDNWRQGTEGGQGFKPFTLTIPKVFEPQTNFSDAVLSVGMSSDAKAVAQCLVPDVMNDQASTSTATINGIVFTVFNFSDAGAGNYYETTSYRTIHAGQCYAVEYTIHSNQIANYPTEYQLKPFDKTKIQSVLDRIVGTFKFNK